MAKVDTMDRKVQTGSHNESRVGEARVHARWLAKANRLMWWNRFAAQTKHGAKY
jgi:hypothetical protein